MHACMHASIHTHTYRCGVRVRGPGLSDNISGTDPLKDKLPLRMSHPLDATPGTKKKNHKFSKVSSGVDLYSKYSGALTFRNCSGLNASGSAHVSCRQCSLSPHDRFRV